MNSHLDDGRFEQSPDPRKETSAPRPERKVERHHPAGGPTDGDHEPQDDANTAEGRFDPAQPPTGGTSEPQH